MSPTQDRPSIVGQAQKGEIMSHEAHYHEGGCYCGTIRFVAETEPQFTLVCHCSICRRLQGSAMGAPATFFPMEGFRVTRGEEYLREFLSPAKFSRMFCEKCGSRLWMGFEKCDLDIPMVAVYTTNLDEVMHADGLHDVFEPAAHAFYANRLYDCLDGKPKFVDMAVDFGGSGKMLSDRGVPISPETG